MGTLYIDRKDSHIRLDGNALAFYSSGGRQGTVPIKPLKRVVIMGNVMIEAGVITLFTENDIPITFMNRKGRQVAVTIPYNHNLPRHYEEQRVFLKTEENEDRVKTLITSRRREFHLGTVKRLSGVVASNFIANGFRECDYQTFLGKYKPRSQDQWVVVCGWR